MSSFRLRCSLLSSLLLVGVVALMTVFFAHGALAGAAAAATPAHTGKHAVSKHCYDTGTFKHTAVRIPASCAKPDVATKCYLTSVYKHKTYRHEIDCVPAKKPATAGGAGTSPTSMALPGTTGVAGTVSAPSTINWATARAVICGDGSTATIQDGSPDCADGSWPYCTVGTDFVVLDPQNQQVVCLPNASVPAAGVCDDGSAPRSGGTDSSGAALCADGDNAFLPGDTANDSASNGSCDDGSTPGDGGTSSSGTSLCADGTDPTYDGS